MDHHHICGGIDSGLGRLKLQRNVIQTLMLTCVDISNCCLLVKSIQNEFAFIGSTLRQGLGFLSILLKFFLKPYNKISLQDQQVDLHAKELLHEKSNSVEV